MNKGKQKTIKRNSFTLKLEQIRFNVQKMNKHQKILIKIVE